MNVVRFSGGLRDDCLLRYRAPLPRGPVYDGIVVDDRVVVTKVSRRGVDRRTADDVADVIEQAQAGVRGRWFEGELYPVDARRVEHLTKALNKAVAAENEEEEAD